MSISRKHAATRDRGARDRIVRAAARLYHKLGIENVAFGDVARAARVSRPLVYFYFPTPRALLMAAVLEATRKLRARFEAAVRGAPDGRAETEAIGRAYLQLHADEPDYFFLCMAAGPQRRIGAQPTPDETEIQDESQSAMALLVHAIERGQRDGSIDPKAGPPPLIALCLWSMTHGLAQFTSVQADALQHEYRISADAFLDAGINLLNRGLSPRT